MTERPPAGRGRAKKEKRGNRASGMNSLQGGRRTGAGLWIVVLQSVISILFVAAVYTLQFVEPERYEQAGEYFKSIMSGEESEEPVLSALTRPIEDILRDWSPETVMEVFGRGVELPKGGEEPVFPRKASFQRVVVSAAARSPLPCDAVVTSLYGTRDHPISGKWDFHTGIDLAAPAGTEIRAIYPGTVKKTGTDKGYGNYVLLEHGSGLSSLYCHCDKVTVKRGDHRRAGEPLATVGTTGVSTGPHLHLSVLLDGYYIDPLQLYLL